MAGRWFVAAAMSVGALALVIGVSAGLSRSAAPGQVDALPSHEIAAIHGDGARGGHIGETTLHHAHVRGSEPVACVECHDIEADDFKKPDRDRCLRCHPARKAALHASVDDADVKDGKDPRECTRCHDFLDTTPTADRAWQCKQCHPQPHTDDMRMAGSTAETCGRCHSPHGDQASAPKACIGCHENKATGHQTTDDPGTGSCLACHRQHDAKANAIARCAECHGSTDAKVPHIPTTALFANGHVACIGCHEPHTFTRRTVRPCVSCHVGQVALAASRVGAHRDCRNCHDQHDVAASAQTACQRCHTKISPVHPKNANGHSCLGCHPAHPGRTETARPAVACTSCHQQKAASDRGLHRGAACSDCHQEHGFKLTASPQFCLGCHAGRVGQAAPVAVGTQHSVCARCHGDNPHAPQTPPPCATCHPTQGSTVPAGHATCTNCHDQHSTALKPSATTCVSCHPERKIGPHGAIKGGCQNCHRPHAPNGQDKPPTCTTCHDRSKLPGMHAVPKHDTCTNCHQPHGPPPLSREVCLRCHTDRVNHEPAANACVGCHPFAGGKP